MPGVFEVNRKVPVGPAIEDTLLIAECSIENEWEGQVRYLPYRIFCRSLTPSQLSRSKYGMT